MRRADPAKRDRTQASPKPVARANDAQPSSKDKMDSHVRGNDERSSQTVRVSVTIALMARRMVAHLLSKPVKISLLITSLAKIDRLEVS